MPKWKEKYSLGHETLDRQHKSWFEKVNNFQESFRQRKGTEEIGKHLDSVLDYTKKHFSTEEGFQEDSTYPDVDKHKRIHRNFTEKIQEIKDEFEENDGLPINRLIEINSMLSDWLINHVTGIDQELKEHLD